MGDFLPKVLSDFSIEIALSILTHLLTIFIGIIIGHTYDNRKRRKLKRILGFKKYKDAKSCEIILPRWEGNLEYNHDDFVRYQEVKGIPPRTYEYIQNEEAESLLHIQNICNIADIKLPLVLKSSNATDLSPQNNKFLCGGPLSNIYLKRIFSGDDTSPFSFKKRFLFGVKPTWMSRDVNAPFLEIEKEISSDTKGRMFFIEKDKTKSEFEEIYIREGFMVFIKQTLPKQGTHFICFGNSALTSMKAVKCLIDATDILYNVTKKHKTHFFIILKCSYEGIVNFENDNIIDITKTMFGTD